jgi:hypothetical protein
MTQLACRVALLAAGLAVAGCAVVPPEDPYPQPGGNTTTAAPPQHLPPSPPSGAPIGTNAPLPVPGT